MSFCLTATNFDAQDPSSGKQTHSAIKELTLYVVHKGPRIEYTLRQIHLVHTKVQILEPKGLALILYFYPKMNVVF